MATLKEIQQAEIGQLSVSQRVEAFFKGTDAVRLFAHDVMIPVLCGQLNLNDRELAVIGIYYRMYLRIQSLVALNSSRHFQTAASETRALFELLLDLKLLAGDSDGSMTAKFHAFTEVDRFRVAKQIVDYNAKHPGSGIDDTHQRNLVTKQGKQQAIDRLASTHWGKTKAGNPQRPNHWSGLTMKERAAKCGSAYEELYIESYPFLNWSVHAGSVNYAGLDKNSIESCFGLCHNIAQRCFLDATAITARIVGVEQAVERFDDILETLRRTPGMVLVEELARITDGARAKSAGGNIVVP
jgi:Family of unknown function (DUF5677)